MTDITIVGNLTDDPELRFTPSGQAVANFNVAVNKRILNRQTNEWEDGEASFFRVNVWREQAESVAESLTRGTRVIVTGKLEIRSYDKRDGSGKGISVEITADEVGPSLKYATAKVTRTPRQQGQGGGNGGGNQGGYANQGAPQQGGYSQPANDPWAQPAGVTGGDEPPF